MDETVLLILVVGIALFFDFTNGFHDAANAIATGISTRAWHPRAAVLVAAILNFAGAFAISKVAATVAKGIVDPGAITLRVVLAGLVGSISWNLLTWYFGLPSSSSHALIGGILGSGVAAVGFSVVLSADFERPPVWVIAAAATAIAAGTYAGGWRIIRTLGQRIAKLEPPQGFAAEAATSLTLYFTAHFGFPVSTTHTISGGVLGAGAARRLSAVRWGIAGNILTAWLLTIPCAALVGAGMQLVTRIPGGALLVFLLGVAIAVLAFTARSRQARALSPAPQAAGSS